MKHYFKRHWNETTGQELTDSWGTSTYYFETDEELSIIRQIEVFEDGKVLKYDTDFIDDEFGGLGDQQLDEEEFRGFSISENEFETAWKQFERQVK